MERPECLPSYDGRGLANLGATLCAQLGGWDHDLLPPLADDVLPPTLRDGVTTLVLLLVDGLGMHQLRRAIAAGDVPTLARLVEDAERGSGSLAPITSVFPSATMAALASVHTGLAPNRHGIVGWTVYLEEFGGVAEMARWGPVDKPGTSYQDPRRGGHDPVAFLGVPTVYSRLARRGVRSYVVNPAEYRGSALSRMIFAGAQEVGYRSPSGLAVALERLLAEPAETPRLIYAYYPGLDLVSHLSGPRSAEHAAELAAFDFLLGRWLRRTRRDGRTLCLLTADHGHVFTPPEGTLFIDQYPTLLRQLVAPPSGERRLLYLHARPGRLEAAREQVARLWGDAVEVRDSDAALAAGLFGPGEPSPVARRRIGDLLALARDDRQLTYGPQPGRPARKFAGNHGALDPDEMLVPLLAWRL